MPMQKPLDPFATAKADLISWAEDNPDLAVKMLVGIIDDTTGWRIFELTERRDQLDPQEVDDLEDAA